MMLHTLKVSAPHALLLAVSGVALIAPHAQGVDPVYEIANQQVGINAITAPSTNYSGQHDRMTGGVTVGDFNVDGWPDLYIPGLGTVPDMLFINQQDGTFADEAASWGIDTLHLGQGSAVGDVNNDGYPDLYVVSFGPASRTARPGRCLLYINSGPDAKGEFSFSEEAEARGVNEVMSIAAGKGAAFGDMDLDGDLDLYVATWQFNPGGGGNRLFENDGTGHFTNVSQEMLPEPPFVLRGFTPKLVDVTGDRYPDLLLTCDFATSRLYVNNGPDELGRVSFRDETETADITHDNNGMGATVNDFDGDGLLDWFQTNIYVQTANYYNTLYMGMDITEAGDPVFQQQALTRGVQDNGWGWGVVSGDYDNDGDVDMVATNGWPQWPNEPTRYWRNDGTGHFADVPFITGLWFHINGRGLVHLDYDRDGDLDLAFIDNGGPFRIYRNDLDGPGLTHYLRVDLDTSTHPCLAPMGYGTRLIATFAGREHLRVIDGSSSYLGQSELTAHFGLGEISTIDELRIEWADGTVTLMTDVPADQHITVNAYHRTDLTQDARVNYFDVSALIRAYTTNDPVADIDANGSIDVLDIMAFLSQYSNPCQR